MIALRVCMNRSPRDARPRKTARVANSIVEKPGQTSMRHPSPHEPNTPVHN